LEIHAKLAIDILFCELSWGYNERFYLRHCERSEAIQSQRPSTDR
jgi:hypothetical protein